MLRTIIINTTLEELYLAAAPKIVQVVAGCRKEGRACFVALAGGSTPRGLYRLLAEEPYRSQISWEHLRVFWGDERMVPPDHPESNFRMAEETLLSHVPIPAEQVFRIKGELPPEEAAAQYEAVLLDQFQLSPGEIPRFDLIILGMGADGRIVISWNCCGDRITQTGGGSVDRVITDASRDVNSSCLECC